MTRSLARIGLAALAAAGCQLEIQYEPDGGTGAVSFDGNFPTDAALPCDAGFHRAVDPMTGRCYMSFLERRTHEGAIASCAAIGAGLAVVTSEDENRVIASVLPSIEDVGVQVGAWLGGSDLDGDARFTWIDGAPFDYIHWRPGEPSFVTGDGTPERCLTIDLGAHVDGMTGYWNDRDCAATIPFVCAR